MNYAEMPAVVNGKSNSDKKRLKKLSNIFTVPLILQIVVGTVALAISAITAMLLHGFLQNTSGSFKYFYEILSESNNSDVLNDIFYGICYIVYMFILLILIASFLKQNIFKTVPMKIAHKELIVPAIIIGLLFSIIGEFYADYIASLLQIFNLQVHLDQFNFPNNTPALIAYAIQISVLAPLFEEFIFRGMILQNLRKYGNVFAVIVSSALFGILHGNFAQTPFAFLVGVALALIVLETGSIWVSILVHCLVNSFSLVLDGLTYYYSGNLSSTIYVLYIIIVIILSIMIFVKLFKKNYFANALHRYSVPQNLTAPEAIAVFVKTPGCIIFIVMFSLTMFLSLKPV